MLTLLAKCRVSFFAEVLRSRALALSLIAVGILQLAATQLLNVGFPCAFHSATGMPCPGCGMTRSMLALVHGHVTASILLHPFGPLVVLGILFTLFAVLLPRAPRYRLAAAVESFEVRTGLIPLLFVLFMLVWVLRITGAIPLASI